MDFIPFCFKRQGNEQVIVFLSIETHLSASHVSINLVLSF